MKIERVSVEDNFFQDLGAHSLLMARFCSEIRKQPGPVGVSMRDIYLNPTIAKLAAPSGLGGRTRVTVQAKQQPFRIPSNLEYYGCGALQLLFYAAYGAVRPLAARRRASTGPMRRSTTRPSSICASWRSRSAPSSR